MQRTRTQAPEGDPITLSLQDVAKHIRVSRVATVRDMIKRGELPKPDFRVGGRPRWIRARFIDALEERARATKSQGEDQSRGAAHRVGDGASGSLAGSLQSSGTLDGAPHPTSAKGGRDVG